VCVEGECITTADEGGDAGAAGCVIDERTLRPGERNPENPCEQCLPANSSASWSPLDDGAPCDNGTFCDGEEHCESGACSPTGEPACADPQPSCDEEERSCVCTSASCDDGLYCNGEEVCGPSGSCAAATPVVCAGATPVCSEALLGECTGCVNDADCTALSPSCVDGSCLACPTCLCPGGFHDGGDGGCFADGECAAGFSLSWEDSDLDGVGAGEISTDCTALPLAAGRSDVGTDCAPDDDTTWVVLTVFPDLDEDGYTVASQNLCVGSPLPPTLLAAPSPPPRTAPRAYAEESSGSWFGGSGCNGAHEALVRDDVGTLCEDGSGDDGLYLRDWQVNVTPSATILGVAVHVRRRLEGGVSGPVQDEQIRLIVEDDVVGENRADTSTAWPMTYAEVAYGGAADTWGVALTAADLNAADFGVFLSVSGPKNDDGEIDHVWLEVFTDSAEDCADDDDQRWSTLRVHADADGDQHSPTATAEAACGQLIPAGKTTWFGELDCDDDDPDVFGGQTRYFSVERATGGYDYDCDDEVTKRSLAGVTQCTCAAANECNSTQVTAEPAGACGTSFTHYGGCSWTTDQCGGTCVRSASSREVECQ